MHPAYSVILFTTASGAGYGLLFWLCLFQILGAVTLTHWSYAVTLVLALALITLGLLSSTFHLGHPERAWRALSQWRTSWLSREGVAAVATYAPAGALLVMSLAAPGLQVSQPSVTGTLSALAATGAVATVVCTAMIYASLRTVPQWNLALVPVAYLALAAASGLLLATLCLTAFNGLSAPLMLTSVLALLGAGGVKLLYWRRMDGTRPRFTAAQALGMGADGIRQLDPPHTQPNFVMREMGYDVARRHALRLRRIALLCLVTLPVLLLLAALNFGGALPFLLLATLSAGTGLVIERWLFFAEASHMAMLYYGKQEV
jgi:DMSO reductase anchor subunit